MRISAVSPFFKMPIPYRKPYLDERQHVALLKSRGLIVSDNEEAVEFLKRVNYYRLTGYAIPFLVDREHFVAGASFEDLLAVYRFDRIVRDLLAEALEVAELAYRTIVARQLSKVYGPLGYRDASRFRDGARFAAQIRHFDETIRGSHEPCIEHFKISYGPTQVPIWALVEVETFGPITRLFDNAGADLQSAIADEYGIRPYTLKSYLQHLRVLRNFCAHHARLFGRMFYGYRPFVEWSTGGTHPDTRRLFSQFLFVYRMIKGTPPVCFDREDWKARVCRAFDSVPKVAVSDIRRISGIPGNAASSPLWI